MKVNSMTKRKARRKGKKLGFNRLEKIVEKEYLRKGYSKKRASYIAHSVAGHVARMKRSRK